MLYYEAHDGARIFYTDAGQGRPLQESRHGVSNGVGCEPDRGQLVCVAQR